MSKYRSRSQRARNAPRVLAKDRAQLLDKATQNLQIPCKHSHITRERADVAAEVAWAIKPKIDTISRIPALRRLAVSEAIRKGYPHQVFPAIEKYYENQQLIAADELESSYRRETLLRARVPQEVGVLALQSEITQAAQPQTEHVPAIGVVNAA